MSIARYSSMAAVSAARACSRWPILVYRVPRPQVAVGLRAGACQFFGQGEGLLVVGCGLFNLWGIAPVATSPRRRRAHASWPRCLMLAADFHRMPRLVQGVLDSAGSQIPFAQRDDAKHMVKDDPHGVGLFHHPLQQRQGLSHTPGQDIRRA